MPTSLRLALTVAALSIACASAPTQAVVANSQFEARAGDRVRVSESATTVAITSIADSRCPTDVQCITAGDVVVIVHFSGDRGERSDTLRLAASPHEATYGAHTLQLLDVRPLPRSSDTNRVSVAVLRVRTAP